MDESCRTCMSHVTFRWFMSHVDKSCRKFQRVVSDLVTHPSPNQQVSVLNMTRINMIWIHIPWNPHYSKSTFTYRGTQHSSKSAYLGTQHDLKSTWIEIHITRNQHASALNMPRVNITRIHIPWKFTLFQIHIHTPRHSTCIEIRIPWQKIRHVDLVNGDMESCGFHFCFSITLAPLALFWKEQHEIRLDGRSQDVYWIEAHRQDTATRCNTLQHVATHCNTFQLRHTLQTRLITVMHRVLQQGATHCNTLQHTAILSSLRRTLQTRLITVTHRMLQQGATHVNTLNYTATRPGCAIHCGRISWIISCIISWIISWIISDIWFHDIRYDTKHTHMYVRHTRSYTHTCMCDTRTHIHIHTYTHTCMCDTHTHTHTHTHMHTHAHVCATHAHTHTHTHVHTYTRKGICETDVYFQGRHINISGRRMFEKNKDLCWFVSMSPSQPGEKKCTSWVTSQ